MVIWSFGQKEIHDKTDRKMELILHRTRIHRDTTDGYVTIGGVKVCDTAEHTPVMLKPGRYALTRNNIYLAVGNGVYALSTPTIIVGEYRCRGVVIHSRPTYLRIYERLKKAFARKEEVVLEVKETMKNEL